MNTGISVSGVCRGGGGGAGGGGGGGGAGTGGMDRACGNTTAI